MRQVYAPANVAEAHILAHLLEQAGIQARIHGEALQGAVGELPASNLLQLVVSDRDYERARQLLLEWEMAHAPPEVAKEAPARARRFPWLVAVACLVLGALIGWVLNTVADPSGASWGP